MNVYNMFIPAYGVASTGLGAVRFDGRNNYGNSDGDILDYKLGLLLEDARLAAEQLVKRFGRDDFVIVSMSISAPIALMLAREYPRSRVVMFVPAIDLCHTVEATSRTPGCMAGYREGNPDPEILNVFGHMVRGRQVFEDLRASGLSTTQEVLDIARSVRGRANLVMAQDDEFCKPEVNATLIETLDARDSTLWLEGVGHDFGRSPRALKQAFDYLVRVSQEHFGIPEEERAGGLPPEALIVAAAKRDRSAIDSCILAAREPA